MGCVDTDDGAVDSGGNACDWYVDNPTGCGDYDDDDFSSDAMCCVCTWSSWDDDDESPTPACDDTDSGAVDLYGDHCDDYASNPSWCSVYDDDDFSSDEMCCACGGAVSYTHLTLPTIPLV